VNWQRLDVGNVIFDLLDQNRASPFRSILKRAAFKEQARALVGATHQVLVLDRP
jgi:hypothetical protein